MTDSYFEFRIFIFVQRMLGIAERWFRHTSPMSLQHLSGLDVLTALDSADWSLKIPLLHPVEQLEAEF